MKTWLKFVVIVLILMVEPTLVECVFSQPPVVSPKEIPIDGGLSFLLVAGLVYGAKKLHDNRNNEEFNKF